ncbi:penicillin acylase family protein [Kutzneria sp. CA-103260]|uniref:penicillin acylase family protein n=1 Tax=Kutzneria sp. CA-103260 TaxID=2802641 RepID=UPI001BAC3601|nr:penicillin acylase family protein [Kutzneria sp. CA-103260]QUQ69355.1 penicillin acylase [Kutzneria sp. CA-103260]
MSRSVRIALAATLFVATSTTLLSAAPATAAPANNDYCLGQCNDILPPGENGNATLVDILGNKTVGTRPAHTDDQLNKYANLVNSYAGLTNGQLSNFFDDSSFGVPTNQVESTISPRSDVTIVRDKATGVPHVTGTTRSGTEFGAGYAAAQDRLWLMDVFRHVGRGELTSFAGGAVGNRGLEQTFWQAAPYTEADLQNQLNAAAATHGARGAQALQDATDYVAGINAYITQAYSNRTFPGEYDLTGHIDPVTNAGGIDPFKVTDMVAIGSVVGALFGTGGGGEVQSALVKLAADAKYGVTEGDKVWNAFREQNDPEAITTIHDGSFPYGQDPANPQGVAMPDPGSVTPQQLVFDPTGSAQSATEVKANPQPAAKTPEEEKARGIFDNGVLPADLISAKHGMSNALLVSGKYTDTGNPVAVFGPQTGYFAPQLLMLEDLQGPGISARGAAFAGVSLYVELGRGQDYSWSATSAGQDITDTWALRLCDPSGKAPTKDSNYYLYHGACTAMEPLERDNSWKPTLADGTAEGSYKLISFRTKYGIVQSRATVGGAPVAYASLRSSYNHEVDSIIGFQEFNDPSAVHDAASFQKAAADVNYTFNWFYTDSKDIAYFNSGNNPVRAANTNPNLPIWADQQNEWQGWNPTTNVATYTGFAQHPNSIDQDYYVSWNNKQAKDFTEAGFGDGSVHRVNLLDSRVKKLISSGQKVTRASLTSAMEDAANADLRAEDVLPEALRVLNSQPITDPTLANAVKQLTAWQQAGSHRLETTPGSHTYANAAAIQIMDAWWSLLVQGEFQPAMGGDLFNAMTGAIQINESPSGGQNIGSVSGGANESQPHKGSSFQYGWWSYVDKDLRAVLGDPVQGGLSQTFCGNGNLAQCRQSLLTSLQQAVGQTTAQVYPGDPDCSAGDQWCADSIIQRPLGGITDGKISWQNRPTYQQVVQYPAHRGDNVANLAQGKAVTATSHETGAYDSPPANAVDGKADTRWASDWSDNQSITVDLGAVQTVGRAILNWESSYAKGYRIDVSTDGSTWRTVWSTTAGDGGVDNDAFTPTTARYVRMSGVQRGTKYGYSLYEFQVYSL